MNVIEVKNVSKVFREKNYIMKALDRVSLKVNKGEIYGLLGPNGAGKTTLINILSTILFPSSGKAEVLGFDVVKQSREVRKRIGICFGESRFFWSFTTKEILNYYGMIAGLKRAERIKKIDELAEKIDFKKFYDREFYQLSRGMKQKVAFAKSILSEPEVLLMDEPTIGLDVDVAIDMRNILIDLAKGGTTVLLTSHNMHEVEALCKKITLIDKGRVVKEGNILGIKKKIKFADTISLVLNRYNNLEFLKRINGVKSYKIDENRLNIRVKSSKDSISKVLELLKRKNYKIKDLEIRDINLEEAFLKIVGGKNV